MEAHSSKSHVYSMCVPKNTDLGLRSYVQYERDVHYNGVDHHILVQGSTTQKYFPMSESLLFLIYHVKQLVVYGGS